MFPNSSIGVWNGCGGGVELARGSSGVEMSHLAVASLGLVPFGLPIVACFPYPLVLVVLAPGSFAPSVGAKCMES